jgi:hypothetical protein
MRPKVTQAEVESVMFDNALIGICTECGERRDGVEPDAQNRFCESCKTTNVMGLEQAALTNRVEITD